MNFMPRTMRLTPELVARVPPHNGEPQVTPGGLEPMNEDDYANEVAKVLKANGGPNDLWIFAYGSLIWNPAYEFVEERIGRIHGWHRSFCLGWTTRFRASVTKPGLMLALDRGGTCTGLMYRLPAEAAAPNIEKLFRREMPFKPSAFPPRWVNVHTATGPVRALTFAINRNGGLYAGRLGVDIVADSLATAVGERGSMAEYLYATVRHLEDKGIHDRHLWQLQDMVAERIERGVG